jgi:uncharacterized protein YukE
VVGWLVDEVVPGSPAAFFGLAAGFSEVALTASEVLSDLNLIRGQVDSSIWRGDAAEAFVDEIGKLPSQLEKLHSSYSSASLCMRAYGTSLADLRLRAAVACRAGVEAESAESSAQGARAGAVAADSHLRAAALPDAPPVPAADFSGHDSAIVAARGRIAAAREELRRVGDERKTAEAVCVGALRDASAEGIRNDSWWRHALVATLKFVGSVCRVVAIVLLIVAVIVVILVTIVLFASGLGLLAAFLAGCAMVSTIMAVATALQAIALATDAGLKTMGESDRSWTSMGIEAVLLALPLVGSKASPFLSKLALGERLAARSAVAARVAAKFETAGAEAAEFLAKRAMSKSEVVTTQGLRLNSSDGLMGVEKASPELIEAVAARRSVTIATEGTEELRYLNAVGAEANVGGETMTHIILRENPSKAAVLEEFLHGTQHKLGIIDRLGQAGAEAHVKDFMIRYKGLLGLSEEDVAILQILKDAGL